MAENQSCLAYFDVRKFFLQEYICYQLTSIFKDQLYDHLIVAFALNYPSVYYRIRLNSDKFYNVRVLKVIVHRTAEYPSLSAGFAPVFQRDPKTDPTDSSVSGGGYQMTYSTVDVFRLKPPYTTMCKDYSKEQNHSHASICYNDCMVENTLAAFDKYPFATIGGSLPVKHINR